MATMKGSAGELEASTFASITDDRPTDWAALRLVVDALANEIQSSADTARTDRLWPADAMVYQTNPLSVAHGACGTALFLYRAHGQLSEKEKHWLQSQIVDVEHYPPGLYSGIAGIAWTFAELGWLDRAIDVLEQVPSSKLRFKFPWIFDGAAGWGLTSLEFYRRTKSTRYLDWATSAAEHIVSSAQNDAQGCFWRDERNGVVRLGYAYGGSGIAHFLVLAGQATGQCSYIEAARKAIDFEVAHGQEQRGHGLAWGATLDDAGHGPYWLRGGGGVATALVRIWSVLREPHFLAWAERAALPCAGFFSAAPHAFEGLAAMGETLLDMYHFTGDTRYLKQARLKASQTLLFRIERAHGLAFPGRFLFRISHDLGTGGAGIGLFLLRALVPGPRAYHDLTSNNSS